MVLGIGGFRPSIGDLVKVINEAYKPIAKGTISRIVSMSETGDVCIIEENEDVPVCTWDLELVAYRIGRYDVAAGTGIAASEDSYSWEGDE